MLTTWTFTQKRPWQEVRLPHCRTHRDSVGVVECQGTQRTGEVELAALTPHRDQS